MDLSDSDMNNNHNIDYNNDQSMSSEEKVQIVLHPIMEQIQDQLDSDFTRVRFLKISGAATSFFLSKYLEVRLNLEQSNHEIGDDDNCYEKKEDEEILKLSEEYQREFTYPFTIYTKANEGQYDPVPKLLTLDELKLQEAAKGNLNEGYNSINLFYSYKVRNSY